MQPLIESLTAAVSGATPVALVAAFAWGVLSIVLSPCHLATIPLVVGFVQGGPARPDPRRALVLSTLFAAGILVTIALLGLITAAAGRLAGDVGAAGNVLVAAVLIGVGLVLADVVPLALPAPVQVGRRSRGAPAALLMGLVFGLALGPCTFAFLAPMLAVAFRVAAGGAGRGAALLLSYGLGHCLVIALAGAGSAWVQRTLDWNAGSRAGTVIRRTCGVLVVVGGLYVLRTAR
ncbi:MAG TPA: cytochrome c biogenesis protein CcdA [Candidatus Krumholzibacteria bacterium]|nr:cytochrome c biogenesis protein CcdA [Candidatus Krumholzibacteria bacterium]